MTDLGNKLIMAENIKYYMDRKGISQTDFCNDLGFPFMTVSDWVNAKTYPRIDKIEMMANYFKVNKSDLIESRKEEEKGYYVDGETAEVAQKIMGNPELKLLFEDAANTRPEDLETVHQMLLALKRKEQGG